MTSIFQKLIYSRSVVIIVIGKLFMISCHLKSLLKDEAATLLKHITIFDANYNEAWEKLIEHYDNSQSIVNSCTRSFITQPHITNLTATSLRKLSDKSDELIRGLKALGDEANTIDSWQVYLIVDKLDVETKKRWSHETVFEETVSSFRSV